MQEEIQENAIYQHYKGNKYRVLCSGVKLESDGENGQEYVVYESLKDGDRWTRPVKEFLEVMGEEGSHFQRFQLVA